MVGVKLAFEFCSIFSQFSCVDTKTADNSEQQHGEWESLTAANKISSPIFVVYVGWICVCGDVRRVEEYVRSKTTREKTLLGCWLDIVSHNYIIFMSHQCLLTHRCFDRFARAFKAPSRAFTMLNQIQLCDSIRLISSIHNRRKFSWKIVQSSVTLKFNWMKKEITFFFNFTFLFFIFLSEKRTGQSFW